MTSEESAWDGGFFTDNQHTVEPSVTSPAPTQKSAGSGAFNQRAAKSAESTGIKYEAPARSTRLPCKIPTFHAAYPRPIAAAASKRCQSASGRKTIVVSPRNPYITQRVSATSIKK